ncbi:MAG TPA: SDR family oxidoreductase [Candidatus Dormibacteraeota bacterium]|nr:SDR family oxidoreductase [Candidatus Dormibacteraeota bacterium]
MELKDKVVVITGGAGGIGSALGRRFSAEGARMVVLADRDGSRAEEVAASIGPGVRGVACDTGDDVQVKALIEEVESHDGPIDLYCANAGIALGTTPLSEDAEWEAAWHVNLMGTVVAARHLLPRWLERGRGYLLVTASAAGLLSTLGDAAYTATKHAAVGLAEWIWITYSDRGVKVSCLCPQGVRTNMVMNPAAAGAVGTEQVIRMGLIEPEKVAATVVEGLADERFLILPHPEVAEYFRHKGENHGRWLGGMRKMQRQLESTN